MIETFNDSGGIFSKTVTSSPCNLKEMIEWFVNIIDDSMERDRFSICIKQCYDEIASNAFEHGNKFDPVKKVHTTVFLMKDSCQVTVMDEGAGFDWKYTLQLRDMRKEALRGRGLHIVRRYADHVVYNDMGNEVKLNFSRRKEC